MIGICEQLQLKQIDGAPPLLADIQSNPIIVTVVYDGRIHSPDSHTWNLAVPASGIVNLTVPASAARMTIRMTVVTLSRLFRTLNCTDEVERSLKWLV